LKKALLIIFILIGLTSCKAQEVSGIWMSYNNYVIDIKAMYTSGDEGVIIDFDNQTIGKIQTDSTLQIKIDYKKSKLFLKSDTLNIDFKVYGKDSILINSERNMIQVFRPLDLSNKLTKKKKEIENYLTNPNFDKINDSLKIKFSKELHFVDKQFSKPPYFRFALINKSWNDEGYWYIKEINQNFFLIFTIEQMGDKYIYQIISVNNCEIVLKQLQKGRDFKIDLTKLKTCL
jgi:hypothetical protein